MANLALESWTWYGLTWLVVITRMVSQIMLRGSLKKLKMDDYLMVIIMLADTIIIIVINIISTTATNLIDPKYPASLLPEDVRERVFGSKMVVLEEQMQCLTIWLNKACLLLMYHRLTMTLKSNLVVKLVACYVALGFVLMEILYLGVWCRPFDQYWAVPPNSIQCSAATNHLITNAVLNISSDIMIILIPIPIFIQSRLALKKKLILVGVFALGIFTIFSAILNKYHSFKSPFGSTWTYWYIRESSTAIIVTNLPLTWTVFRRIFNLGSFNHSDYSSSKNCSAKPLSTARSLHATHPRSEIRTYIKQDGADDHEHAHGSEEDITKSYGISLKIYQRHDVQISSEQAPQRMCSNWSSESLPDRFTTTTVIRGGPKRCSSRNSQSVDVETSLRDDKSYPVAEVTSGI
ncbi:hypothetical protein E4U41_007642 [Claviceps citrina]|nr:hypothetical protein E4U41_007642 [Claviceps citrina]